MARTAIITGASRGIGAAVAERLAKDGFSVVVNYTGSEAEAFAVADRIKSAGGHAITVEADVSRPADVTRMFDAAEKELGVVDVLVNNAGIMNLATGATTDKAMLDHSKSVNLKGPFKGLREAAKRLRNGGRIINFCTSVVGRKLETYDIYAATKSAVEIMMAVLSKELRGRSITINAVVPNPRATDLFLHGKSEELIEHFGKTNPLERLGAPRDIASAVAFLAGPDGSWINGQVLRANRGIV